jgi:hypothetical protein
MEFKKHVIARLMKSAEAISFGINSAISIISLALPFDFLRFHSGQVAQGLLGINSANKLMFTAFHKFGPHLTHD